MDADDEPMVFDHQENISFSRRSLPLLNIQPLHDLPYGLAHLARDVRRQETDFASAGVVAHLGAAGPQSAMMACFFEWFASSLVNYERLVGLLAFLGTRKLKDKALVDQKIGAAARAFANDYAERISPAVVAWRNKVAAHYAITSPRNKDSLDDLRQSVTANVGFTRGRFRAVAFRWSNSTFPEWSLTEEFERLSPRFWPQFRES